MEGSVVIEPERRRLLRSANTDDAAGAATEAEWRSVGGIGAGGVKLSQGRYICSLSDSVDVGVLGLGELEAAHCWSAGDTSENLVLSHACLCVFVGRPGLSAGVIVVAGGTSLGERSPDARARKVPRNSRALQGIRKAEGK